MHYLIYHTNTYKTRISMKRKRGSQEKTKNYWRKNILGSKSNPESNSIKHTHTHTPPRIWRTWMSSLG